MEVEDAEILLEKKSGGFLQIHIGPQGDNKPDRILNLNDSEAKELSNALKLMITK